ncbi:MAG: flagellar protein FlgN [Pseudomonadota bacterium]
MPAKLLFDLRSVLADERAALLEARYSALEALAEAKVALVTEITRLDVPDNTLAELQGLMDGNKSLLEAAMRGVRAATDRLSALQDVKQGLSVYDASGTLDLKKPGKSTFEKKA